MSPTYPYTGPGSIFDSLAMAIGHLCISWSHAEEELNSYFRFLVPIESIEALPCITENIDFRQKIQIVKSLGFLKKPNDAWYDSLAEHLDILDNDCRVKRNRYVHDLMLLKGSPTDFLRKTGAPKVINKQSFQRELAMPKLVDVSVDEVNELTRQVDECRDNLASILHDYRLILQLSDTNTQ